MNNFDIHKEAQRMAERDSAYAIARRYIETRNDTEQFQRMFARTAEELYAMKAALAADGEEAPVGPAISLVEKLRSERDALAAHMERIARCKDRLQKQGEQERKRVMPLRLKGIIEDSPRATLAERDARLLELLAKSLEARGNKACANASREWALSLPGREEVAHD